MAGWVHDDELCAMRTQGRFRVYDDETISMNSSHGRLCIHVKSIECNVRVENLVRM